MAEGTGKNDLAWQTLFDRYAILSRIDRDGYFIISANRIKASCNREPRLMAKFDHASNLPAIFREHSLSILPVSRGEYILSRFQCYLPLVPDAGPIRRVTFPGSVTSIDPTAITSEAVAINCAAASGIFADFLNEKRLVPTVSGRMGSGTFGFRIIDCRSGGEVAVEVNNAQIEIDAAFEGRGSLAIIEAKRDLSDDFIIRQLFYPFKTWERKIPKAIRLIYMVYTNGIFNLHEYAVENSEVYNSLKLVKSARYSVDDTEIRRQDIERVIDSVTVEPEPEIPFPQADSFERIINLCELLNADALTRDSVTEQYDFTARQTNYYTDAARYLGLLEKENADGAVRYRVTSEAREVFRYRYRERQLKFCEIILRHRVFRDVYLHCLRLGRMPGKEEIVAIMKQSGLYRLQGESTYKRRASTVAGWLNWIDSLWMKGLFALPPVNRE